ncbi:hypothetical protein [Aquibacillus salsiterrae]|uniref:Type 4 fimbrial biogenesis protein PilX N-terminal domain-containing protein n=1 Tax=Aquibacillus salsiterrae TaxID=2950439 RepID=A0A9X3WC21_9BACI|nr:hypothetical protein [Aquibacillus salsiterrae]MDC3416975.1 hypothetical protein [Aquibacillus salsiterrae]
MKSILLKVTRNQSGAALLIILFIILFLSIIATVTLKSTTYGLEKVTTNKKAQEEFYRAEGAIEIVLAEMKAYDDGIFEYLKNFNQRTYKEIGGKDLAVDIEVDHDLDTINLEPTDATTPPEVKVTLDSKYDNSTLEHDKSTVSRILNFSIYPTPFSGGDALKYYESFYAKENNTVNVNVNSSQLTQEIYNSILEKYNIDWSNWKDDEGNFYPSIGKSDIPYDFNEVPSKIIRLEEISYDGKSGEGPLILEIPSDTVVFVKNVLIGGSGGVSELIIEGVLIAQKFESGANSNLVINGGLITEEYYANTNTYSVTGEERGINCSLLPEACEKDEDSNKTYIYKFDSDTIDFSTKPN